MKITGGKLRGKTIDARKERALRPTRSFIREAVFNILKHGKFLFHDDFIPHGRDDVVEGAKVIDIFCGTGALGLEAISRGAEHVTLIDQDSETLRVTRRNAKNLGIESQVKIYRSDSTQLPKASQKCDLAFIDPPYGQKLEKKAINSLAQMGWLAHGAVVILENGKQDDAPEVDNFNLLDSRLHDKTRISVYQYTGE